MTTTGGGGAHRWHVSEELAGRYAAGPLPETDAWSVEKHTEACGDCAVLVSSAVRAVRPGAGPVLDGVRARLLAAVAAEGAAARDGAAAGVPRPAVRTGRLLWAAGPALRGAWLSALVLVTVGALALAYGAGAGETVRPLLLVVAPVLPLAGVALSYGRHSDPMHEITAATPSGGLRLLLTRTVAVLAVSVPVLTLAGAALPGSTGGPGAALWLLPGLAMTLAALALGSYVGCRAGAGAVAVVWAAVAVGPAVTASPLAPAEAVRYFTGPGAQGCWAAGALVCAVLLALRRRSFDHLETA
ncbi:zf-HC2 domain-containing protein [Streptomyces sp. NPDC092952]|uniref:zf-HC2 domain-containing protein n=1 Tax=Streptomyces sp. NPDC092952 TaxID=3366018 RepID=UPI0037F21116